MARQDSLHDIPGHRSGNGHAVGPARAVTTLYVPSGRPDLEVDPSTVPGLKFHTPRDERFPTVGHRQAAWARIWLGRELMPWQRLVLNVTGEYDPDNFNLPRYRTAVDTVQRQAGKSDLALVGAGERCFSVPGYKHWYTAQTGQDARLEFLKFYDEKMVDTALLAVVRLLRGTGSELLKYPNLSEMRPFPPNESKLHGKQSDRVDIDEGWWFSLELGLLLMQAIGPTQLTRPGAQTFIHSAGGTAASTWLADWVTRGRLGVTSPPQLVDSIGPSVRTSSFAYFELGVPDDLDCEDVEALAAYHPAVGHTITIDALYSLKEKLPDPRAWARAAGNRWTEIVGGAITDELWQSARHADPLPGIGRVGWGAARSEDGSHVVIALAEELPGGVYVAEIADVVPSYGAAKSVIGWAHGDSIRVMPDGPSAGLSADLVRLEAPQYEPLTGRGAAAATSDLLDGMGARAYRFREHPALETARKVVATRPHGDGGKVLSRTSAVSSIASIEAACCAFAALKGGPDGVPMISF